MFWITGALILLAALPALLNIKTAPLELFANLRPQIFVLALAFGCASFTVGRYGAGATAIVVSALLLIMTPEIFAKAPPPVLRPSLKVIWCNVFKTEAVVERLADVARKRASDVVVLGEPPKDLTRTRQILSAYPFVYGAQNVNEHGAVVFSRFAMTENVQLKLPDRAYPLMVVETAQIRIVAMHPPVAVNRSAMEASKLMFAAARQQANQGRTLVVGDMNATPWSERLRTFSIEMSRLSPALSSTWFSSLPVLGLPIDQAFATTDLRASAKVGPGVGSDHLPLIISIE